MIVIVVSTPIIVWAWFIMTEIDEETFRILWDFDTEAFSKRMPPPLHPMTPEEYKETIEISLHKCRHVCTAIPDDMRLASGRWLHARGYKSKGLTIDPDRLPK